MEEGTVERGFHFLGLGKGESCLVDPVHARSSMFVGDKSCCWGTSHPRVVEVKSVGRWKGE